MHIFAKTTSIHVINKFRLRVTEVHDTIRLITYEFLFIFHCNYAIILCAYSCHQCLLDRDGVSEVLLLSFSASNISDTLKSGLGVGYAKMKQICKLSLEL